jgi:hypothetical protein
MYVSSVSTAFLLNFFIVRRIEQDMIKMSSGLHVKCPLFLSDFIESRIFSSHWGDQDVDGRIILRWIFRKFGWGSCGDWMELAQDRDRWRALVGTVRDFWGL